MIAVAERGWVSPAGANYKSFLIRLRNEKEPLAKLGIKMADESEWDPGIEERIKRTWGHIKKNLSPEMIKVTLFPNKDED